VQQAATSLFLYVHMLQTAEVESSGFPLLFGLVEVAPLSFIPAVGDDDSSAATATSDKVCGELVFMKQLRWRDSLLIKHKSNSNNISNVGIPWA